MLREKLKQTAKDDLPDKQAATEDGDYQTPPENQLLCFQNYGCPNRLSFKRNVP
jgi:hypothetical protein